MNAANFTTFSTGIGSHGFVLGQKYLHDYPSEFYRMRSMGLMKQLPTNKADKELDKPAYVFDVKFSMSASIIAETLNPKLGQLTRNDPEYKYRMYHAASSRPDSGPWHLTLHRNLLSDCERCSLFYWYLNSGTLHREAADFS
eukprot:symbB.v1.2.006906.t1/scaffold418.1/size208590/10